MVIRLTYMETGRPQETWAMRWDHTQQNGLFPGEVGMWVTSDGAITWNDSMGGGPTHWQPLPKTH